MLQSLVDQIRWDIQLGSEGVLSSQNCRAVGNRAVGHPTLRIRHIGLQRLSHILHGILRGNTEYQ